MSLIPSRKRSNIPVTRESSTGAPIAQFRSEMDRLFDRFFSRSWTEPFSWSDLTRATNGEFIPSVDVAENDKTITIRAEMPGMEAKDIDINIAGNVLTLHGEKNESKEEKDEDYTYTERRFGSFSRSIELPASADLGNIEAEQRNGVLTVTVKKLPTAQAKKINVKEPKRELAGAR